jgi:uncharacterized protein (DUF1778 family)
MRVSNTEVAVGKRPGDRGTGTRSEIITVRLDPRTKYLAELAARRQRRTLSSFIEWAVEQSLLQVPLAEHRQGEVLTVQEADQRFKLWDPLEPDRLLRLAMSRPELLTIEEEKIWKVVREAGYLWKGIFTGDPPGWGYIAEKNALDWDLLRQTWDVIREVAAGKRPRSDLPKDPTPPRSSSASNSSET